VLDVRRWAEIRRMREVEGLSIREIARRTATIATPSAARCGGMGRRSIASAAAVEAGPVPGRDQGSAAGRPAHPLDGDPGADRGVGLCGWQDDPRRLRARAAADLRPAAHLSANCLPGGRDLPGRPLGAFGRDPGRPRPGQARLRRRRVPGLSRAGAGALVFSKELPDICWGMSRCLCALGGLPATVVWDREGALCRRTALRPTASPPIWASSRSAGTSAGRATPRPRGWSSDCRGSSRRASSPAAASPMRSTSRTSSTAGSGSAPTPASTARSEQSPPSGCAKSSLDAPAARVAARHRPPLRDPGPCPALHPFRPKRLLARSALRRPPGRGSTRFGASANATTGGAGRRARGARARALAGARDLYRVRQRLPGARERLTERERRRLCALFEREPLIAEAWALKQAFRSIYHAPDRHQAERRLDRFLAAVERAHSSRPSPPSPTRPALARRTARLPRRADHKPLRRGSHQQDQADQAPRPRTPSFDGLPERLLLACARTGPHGATPPDRREPNFRPAV
jgi:hypothetical protein